MAKKKTVLTIMWIVIAIIALAAIASLIIFPRWKGMFLAGSGGFLILNLLLSMFFIHRNFKN
ncbi:MAG: hypothetical protein GX371_00765 [Bacteroidales bacterium]|jgi:uncharacterized membrane protein|nr:hypothetical protein [Bacteroidales bacterium]